MKKLFLILLILSCKEQQNPYEIAQKNIEDFHLQSFEKRGKYSFISLSAFDTINREEVEIELGFATNQNHIDSLNRILLNNQSDIFQLRTYYQFNIDDSHLAITAYLNPDLSIYVAPKK